MSAYLNKNTLSLLPEEVILPPSEKPVPSVVHLGVGAFHRAHQAVYAQHSAKYGKNDWGIVSVCMRSRKTLEALRRQDLLYSLTAADSNSKVTEIVSSTTEVLHFTDDRKRLMEAACDINIKVITMTVSEKAYGLTASGKPDTEREDIAHDIANRDSEARSIIGFLAAVTAERIRLDRPFSILCCDNMELNGDKISAAVKEFIRITDPSLLSRIEEYVSFPNCMVDRIVPSVDEKTINDAEDILGVHDEIPLLTERFSQWVVEDRFIAGRPSWEGVIYVDDISQWQKMKLSLLNGTHSAGAYIGQLLDLDVFRDVFMDKTAGPFLQGLMRHDILAALSVPDEINAEDYICELSDRFLNPYLKHSTKQISSDGSLKIPIRWFPVIHKNLEKGIIPQGMVFIFAVWMRYLSGRSETGKQLEINDPNKDSLSSIAAKHGSNPGKFCSELFSLLEFSGSNAENTEKFKAEIENIYIKLEGRGVRECIRELFRFDEQ